jgi:two-component system, NtrC family, sensor kinase
MRHYITILLFLIFSTPLISQQSVVDSFGQLLSPRVADSFRQILLQPGLNGPDRVIALQGLSYNILFSKPDSAMLLAQQGRKLAREINYPAGEILCEASIGSVWWIIGDYTKANEIFLKCVKSSEKLKDTLSLVWSLAWMASGYRDEGNFPEAMKYCRQGMSIQKIWSTEVWNTIMGSIYQTMNKPDSALFYLLEGDMSDGYTQVLLGHTYAALENDLLASEHYNKSIPLLSSDNNFKDLAYAYIGLARLHEKENKIDSGIYYAEKGLIIAQNASFKKWVYETGLILSRLYEKKDAAQALSYHKLAMTAKDSMFNLQNITQSLNSRFNEQLSQQQAQAEKIAYQNKVKIYVLSAFLGFLLLLAIILWRNNRHKQKAKAKIETAYSELKITQSQLIQSEKMASLGELTAGIAHEIQNPLNFVNNFSDVNKELISELKEEITKGDIKEVNAIACDIEANEEKINHHGKRADAIVKNMLQHSRIGSGKKEPADINTLADEYLRLSYHGLRAKDKSFNAEFKTDFDNSIGKINIMPQDIGRVLLNLINNAFYAVNEKRKQAREGYEPTVRISTKKMGDKVEVSVKDNGYGIPQKILDKIFQPFFTTKPTGQGTGLGLSLSYDIVKAHGGELKVETKEGEGATFLIELPFSNKYG